MIGSPFSVLVTSVFMIAIIGLALFLILSVVRIAPGRLRTHLLIMAALFAAIGTSSILGAQSYMNLRLENAISVVEDVRPDPLNYPFYAIGQIFKTTGLIKPCSGLLVSQDKVITAASCLKSVSSSSGFSKPEIILVQFPNHPVSRVAHYTISEDYDPDARDMPARVIEDWAVLTLDEPVLDRAPVPMTDDSQYDEASYMIAGYPGTVGSSLISNKNCKILQDKIYAFFLAHGGEENRYFLHSCHSSDSSAGAPIITKRDDGEYQMRGFHVSVLGAYNQKLGIGIPAAAISMTGGFTPYKVNINTTPPRRF